MNACDLEPLVWDTGSEARLARHEAGHAIVYVAQGKLDQIDEVSIAPRGKCGGHVRLHGHLPDEEMDKLGPIGDTKELWPDLPDADLSNPDHVRLLAYLGALDYSGVASEFPSLGDGFFTSEAVRSSVYDRECFEACLATRGRLFWSRHAWCGPAFDRAARVVDSAWGEVLVIAAALLERKVLSGPEVADLIVNVPEMRNHRRPSAWMAIKEEKDMEHKQETPSARLERAMREATEGKEIAANLLSRRERLRAESAEKREEAKRQRAKLASGAGDGALRQAREAEADAEVLAKAAEQLDREILPEELRRSQGTARALQAALAAVFDAELERVNEEIRGLREQHIVPLERQVEALKRAAHIPTFSSETRSRDAEVAAAVESSPKTKRVVERLGGAAALHAEVEATVAELQQELSRREVQAHDRTARRASSRPANEVMA